MESFDNARFTQMQANRSAPNLHVGVFTDVLLPLIARSGLVAVLDEKKVPNLKSLDPAVRLPVGRHAVPVTYGTWGIAYNAKKVGKPSRLADLLRDACSASRHQRHLQLLYVHAGFAGQPEGGSLRNPQRGRARTMWHPPAPPVGHNIAGLAQ